MALTDAQKAKLVKLGQLGKFKEMNDGRYYQKPGTGIPDTDLSEAVQNLLAAAGTALQASDLTTLEGKVQTLEAYFATEADSDTIINKWVEIVAFLNNISESQTLEGIVSGINTSINAKYTKPSTGIPATDLADGVQTSLGKADTAYQKPTGGIPKTDLAEAVQTSLGKADSALQSHQDISGKAEKSEMSVVAGTGNDVDKTTITLKTGTSATVLTAHQDISGKVDKVTGKGLSTNDFDDTYKAAVDALVYATDSDVEAIFA